MNSLSYNRILIGKEPNQSRLYISVNVKGNIKSMAVGEVGSVPGSVSRCNPSEGIGHCEIRINEEGTMVLVNLKPHNVTYVNGTEIVSKKITSDSVVELGLDKYVLDLSLVLKAAETIAREEESAVEDKQEKPLKKGKIKDEQVYSIIHLKDVWDKYHNDLLTLQKKQKNLALIKSLYMPCTILSSVVGVAATRIGLDEGIAEMLSYTMYAVAGIVLFYGLFKSFTDKSIEEKERINEEFQQNYICPNSECQHFMGNVPYNILRQNKKCVYCKCKLAEKQ